MNFLWSYILVQQRSTYLIWVFRVECALTIGLFNELSDILLLPVKTRISGTFAVVWKVLTSALMKAASMAAFIAMLLKVIIIRQNLTGVNTIRILRC